MLPQILRSMLFVNALVLLMPVVSLSSRLLVCNGGDSPRSDVAFSLVEPVAGLVDTSGQALYDSMQTSVVRQAFGENAICWQGAHLGLFFVAMVLLPPYVVLSVLGYVVLVDREMDSTQLLAHADPHADVMDMNWLVAVSFAFQVASDVVDVWLVDGLLAIGYLAWTWWSVIHSEYVSTNLNDCVVAVLAAVTWTMAGGVTGVVLGREVDVGPMVVLGVFVAAALGFFVSRARRTMVVSMPLKRLTRVADIVQWARHRVQLAVEGHSSVRSYVMAPGEGDGGMLAALLEDDGSEEDDYVGIAARPRATQKLGGGADSVFGGAQLHGNTRALISDAEKGYQLLVNQHPRSALAALHAALFYKATGVSKNGYLELRMLARAWRLSSAWDVRLVVVLRTWHVTFDSNSSPSGTAGMVESSSVMGADLSGMQRIVYDHHQTAARSAETSAYHTMHTAFSKLQLADVDLESLHTLAMNFADHRRTADTHFKAMLTMNPTSPEVLRAYAAFLTRSFQEEHVAVALLSKAERLEATASRVHVHKVNDFLPGSEGGDSRGDSHWGVQGGASTASAALDDNSAVLVLSAGELDFGDIIACNAASCRIFGRARSEMLGANVRVLVPAPFNQLPLSDMEGFARNATDFLDKWHYMVGIHVNGTLIPVRAMLQAAPPAISGACDPRFALVCQQLQLADVQGVAIVRGAAADDSLSLAHASTGMHHLLGIDAATVAEYDLPIGAWMPSLDRAWRGEPLHGRKSTTAAATGFAEDAYAWRHGRGKGHMGIRHRSAGGQAVDAPPRHRRGSTGGQAHGGRRRSHRASSTSSWSTVALQDEVIKLRACTVTPKGVQVLRPAAPSGHKGSTTDTSDSDGRYGRLQARTSSEEGPPRASSRPQGRRRGSGVSTIVEVEEEASDRGGSPVPSALAPTGTDGAPVQARRHRSSLALTSSDGETGGRESSEPSSGKGKRSPGPALTEDGRPLSQQVSVTVMPLSGLFVGCAGHALFDETYYGFVIVSKYTEDRGGAKALRHRNTGPRTVEVTPTSGYPLTPPPQAMPPSDGDMMRSPTVDGKVGPPRRRSLAEASVGGGSSSSASAAGGGMGASGRYLLPTETGPGGTSSMVTAEDTASVGSRMTRGTYGGAVGLAPIKTVDDTVPDESGGLRAGRVTSLGGGSVLSAGRHATDMTEEQSEYLIDSHMQGQRTARGQPSEGQAGRGVRFSGGGDHITVGTRNTAVSSTMAMLQVMVSSSDTTGIAPLRTVHRVFRSSVISMIVSTLILFFVFFFLLHAVLLDQMTSVGDVQQRFLSTWGLYHSLLGAGGLAVSGLAPLNFTQYVEDMVDSRSFLKALDENILEGARRLGAFTPAPAGTLPLLTEPATLNIPSGAGEGSAAHFSLLEGLGFLDVRLGQFVQAQSPLALWPNNANASALTDTSARAMVRTLREQVLPALAQLAAAKGPDVESHLFFEGWLDMGLMSAFLLVRGVIFGLIAARAAREFDELKNAPLKAMAGMNGRTLKLLQARSAEHLRSALGVDEDEEMWDDEGNLDDVEAELALALGERGVERAVGSPMRRPKRHTSDMGGAAGTPSHSSSSHLAESQRDVAVQHGAGVRAMQNRRGSTGTYASSQFTGASGDTHLREMLANRSFARTAARAAAAVDMHPTTPTRSTTQPVRGTPAKESKAARPPLDRSGSKGGVDSGGDSSASSGRRAPVTLAKQEQGAPTDVSASSSSERALVQEEGGTGVPSGPAHALRADGIPHKVRTRVRAVSAGHIPQATGGSPMPGGGDPPVAVAVHLQPKSPYVPAGGVPPRHSSDVYTTPQKSAPGGASAQDSSGYTTSLYHSSSGQTSEVSLQMSKVAEGLLTPTPKRRRTRRRRLPTVRTFKDTAKYRKWATLVLMAPTIIVMVHIATVMIVQTTFCLAMSSAVQEMHAATTMAGHLMRAQAHLLQGTLAPDSREEQASALNATLQEGVAVRDALQSLLHGAETDFLQARITNPYASNTLPPLDTESATYLRLRSDGCVRGQPRGLAGSELLAQHKLTCAQYNDGLLARGLLDGIYHYLSLLDRIVEAQRVRLAAAGPGQVAAADADTPGVGPLLSEAVELHTLYLAPSALTMVEEERQWLLDRSEWLMMLVHVTNLCSGLLNFLIMVTVAYPLVAALTSHVLASRALMLTLPPEVVQQVPVLRKELYSMTKEIRGAKQTERNAINVAAKGGSGQGGDVTSLIMRADIVLGNQSGASALGGNPVHARS